MNGPPALAERSRSRRSLVAVSSVIGGTVAVNVLGGAAFDGLWIIAFVVCAMWFDFEPMTAYAPGLLFMTIAAVLNYLGHVALGETFAVYSFFLLLGGVLLDLCHLARRRTGMRE